MEPVAFPSAFYLIINTPAIAAAINLASISNQQPRLGPFEGELRPEDAGVDMHVILGWYSLPL